MLIQRKRKTVKVQLHFFLEQNGQRLKKNIETQILNEIIHIIFIVLYEAKNVVVGLINS